MIYLLLPAYNEEASLPKLLPKIAARFKEKSVNYHLVVVNDGSTDKTGTILEEYSAKGDIPMTVLKHEINRGLGETERDGFEHISRIADRDDVLVRVEGDDTHDPKYIFDLIDQVENGFHVVNTSRFQPGGGQKGLDNYRTIISRLANLFMKLVFNIKGVKDYSCGFRAYRVSVIKDAIAIFGNGFVQLRGLGFTTTLEVIVKLKLMGRRFSEVPFILRYDQKESSSKMVSSVTTLGYLVMGILYHWPFGGWKRQYNGLNKLYPQNQELAVAQYNIHNIRRSTISRIGV